MGIFIAALGQPNDQIATIAMVGGGSTSSAGLPMRSRTQAKYKSFTLTRSGPLA
jgi:hypothetical protein